MEIIESRNESRKMQYPLEVTLVQFPIGGRGNIGDHAPV